MNDPLAHRKGDPMRTVTKFESGGVIYGWIGFPDAVMESLEHGVRRNEVRCIGGLLFYADIVASR